MKNIVVLYHGDCRDGFSGAWAAWKKFGSKAEYFGLHYMPGNTTDMPRKIKNKEVYLIDVSLKGGKEMEKLVRENKRVVSLDHHADAEKFAKLAHDHVFDNNHSGAVIAWQYFHPKKKTPLFLRYVEDLDIWLRKLPHTFAVSAYNDLFDFDFKIWDRLVLEVERPKSRSRIIHSGNLILRYQDKKIQELIKKSAVKVEFFGYRTLAINSPNWASQIGSILCRILPPIGIIWSQLGNKNLISLRSDGTADVSKIAKHFGGGGHKAAAGFSIPVNKKLPWKYLNEK